MELNVYNTPFKKKKPLVPLSGNKIGMYVCGVTVYDMCHIGHARSLMVFDIISRFLRRKGYDLTYVRNFTDIDDKIIARANALRSSYRDIADRYIDEFKTDMEILKVLPADIEPKATDHIGDIIEMVRILEDKGLAYKADDGSVYFSVAKFRTYGSLSGRRIEDMIAGARVDIEEMKHDPLDFAVWKRSKEGEPSWDSPWSKGRPGWHIECSAMSMAILGPTFDIHAGGQDLIFPHHENEIAQSEAATGKPFAHYWMHNGYINVDNQKMSKSAGNFFTVRDISKEFDLEAVRMFMLSVQYRNPVNFSRELIQQAESGLERLRTARERIDEAPVAGNGSDGDEEFLASLEGYRKRFCDAMDDDLNTADALGVLFELARASNTFVSEPRGQAAIDATRALFDELTGVLGLLCHKEEEAFPTEALDMLEERQQARKTKDFKRADELRDALKDMGYAVEDTANGPKLKKI